MRSRSSGTFQEDLDSFYGIRPIIFERNPQLQFFAATKIAEKLGLAAQSSEKLRIGQISGTNLKASPNSVTRTEAEFVK